MCSIDIPFHCSQETRCQMAAECSAQIMSRFWLLLTEQKKTAVGCTYRTKSSVLNTSLMLLATVADTTAE